jgi:glucosylceramidase
MCLRDDVSSECGHDAKIGMVQAAFAREPALKLYFSPWSPPAWMKTSGNLVGGRFKGIGTSDRRYVDAWARSYVTFLDLWRAQNVSFWGFTILNEPGSDQFVSWNSMAMSGADEKELVATIGPVVKAKYPQIKLMVHDDQVYALKSRLEQSGAGVLDSEYVDGIAFHWYGTQAGSYENGSVIEIASLTVPVGGGVEVREIYEGHIRNNNKFMLATEACNGYLVALLHTLLDVDSESNNRGVRPGDWYRGYRYSKDILFQIGNGASGWVDWNLLLDSSGGPNWAGNNVDAPVLVGYGNRSLWVSPMFFHLAHWAKYVTPGSIALAVDSSQSSSLQIAAFLRPDNKLAVVCLADELDGHGDPPPNQSLILTIRTPYGVVTRQVDIVSRSISTFIFELDSSMV